MPQSVEITETSLLLRDANCVYCHVDLELNDQVAVCDECSSPHHHECWLTNSNQCATFGCSGVGSILENMEIELKDDKTHRTFRSHAWLETFQRSVPPLKYVIVCFLIMIIGLYFSLPTKPTVTKLSGHTRDVNSVSWSPSGTQIVSGSNDDTLRIWDVASGTELKTLSGHEDTIYSVSWSPDGTQIASSSGGVMGNGDNSVRIWDAASGVEISRLSGSVWEVSSVDWSPDGRYVVSGSINMNGKNSTVRVWDVTNGAEWSHLPDYVFSAWSVSWSPDGRHVAIGSGGLLGGGETVVLVWDVVDRQEVTHLFKNRELDTPIRFRSTPIYSSDSVEWSPDGTQLAASTNRTVRIWDFASEKQVKNLSGHENRVEGVSWSPDGSQIAAGFGNYSSDRDATLDGAVYIWDVASGERVDRLWVSNTGVESVSWSPDGSQIVFGVDDGTVRIWDLE